MSYSRVTTAKGQRLLGYDPVTPPERLPSSFNQGHKQSILDNTPIT